MQGLTGGEFFQEIWGNGEQPDVQGLDLLLPSLSLTIRASAPPRMVVPSCRARKSSV